MLLRRADGMRTALEVLRYASISGQEERWSCMSLFQQKHIVIPGRAMRKHREGKGTQVSEVRTQKSQIREDADTERSDF